MSEFDRFAEEYEQVLAETLRVGGSPRFFQRTKARLIRRLLGPTFSGELLDFGCGVGGLLAELRHALPHATLHGHDPSGPSAERAARVEGVERVTRSDENLARHVHDAVVMANVLHHIDPGQRASVLAVVAGLLRRGGTLFVFEHNPYNPLTRRVVARCPFDEDVELLKPKQIRRLLHDARLDGVRTRYTTFFPQWLSVLLPLERWLETIPLGAQTCTTARAPVR